MLNIWKKNELVDFLFFKEVFCFFFLYLHLCSRLSRASSGPNLRPARCQASYYFLAESPRGGPLFREKNCDRAAVFECVSAAPTSRQGEWLQRRRLYGAWRTSYRRQDEKNLQVEASKGNTSSCLFNWKRPIPSVAPDAI